MQYAAYKSLSEGSVLGSKVAYAPDTAQHSPRTARPSTARPGTRLTRLALAWPGMALALHSPTWHGTSLAQPSPALASHGPPQPTTALAPHGLPQPSTALTLHSPCGYLFILYALASQGPCGYLFILYASVQAFYLFYTHGTALTLHGLWHHAYNSIIHKCGPEMSFRKERDNRLK